MISRLFFIIVILILVHNNASIEGEHDSVTICNGTSSATKIKRDMLKEMVRSFKLWDSTSEKYNIIRFPVTELIKKNIELMFNYHKHGLNSIIRLPKNRGLGISNELARLIEEMEISYSELRFNKAVFYEYVEKNNLKKYKEDIEGLYRIDAIKLFNMNAFDGQLLRMQVNSWLSNRTRGRNVGKEELLNTNSKEMHLESEISFSACWNVTPTTAHRTMNFNLSTKKHNDHKVVLPLFWNVDTVPYVKDEKLNYSSVKLRYKNSSFALVLALPNEDQKFDEFVANLTYKNYREIIEPKNVSEGLTVSYSIPILDLAMIRINQNGTNINGQDLSSCPQYDAALTAEKRNIDRIFTVDRPFGIFLIHEPTKFVILHGWIRDPTSTEYVHRMNLNSEELTRQYFETIEPKHIHPERESSTEKPTDGVFITPKNLDLGSTREPIYGIRIESSETTEHKHIHLEPEIKIERKFTTKNPTYGVLITPKNRDLGSTSEPVYGIRIESNKTTEPKHINPQPEIKIEKKFSTEKPTDGVLVTPKNRDLGSTREPVYGIRIESNKTVNRDSTEFTDRRDIEKSKIPNRFGDD